MHIIKSNTYLEKPLTADALDLHVMIVEAVAPEAAPGLGVVGVADPVTVRAGVGEAGAGAAVEAADPLQVEAAQSLVLIDAVAPGLPDHVVTVLDILLVSCTFQLLNNQVGSSQKMYFFTCVPFFSLVRPPDQRIPEYNL